MHRDTWDDLRFVLAVAETGSVAAAARRLGVNHATVLRRIASFEDRNGAPVFDRTATGYTVRPDRLRVIEAARGAARAVEDAARALGREVGTEAVRITTTDTFCQTVLPAIVATLAAEGTMVELSAANQHVDLGRLSADISVRPAQRLPGDLAGEAAGHLGFAAYATDGGAAAPRWLCLSGTLARSIPAEWMAASLAPEVLVPGADSFPVLAELAARGLGRTVLPCILGEADSRLRRLPDAMPAMSVPIWVALHRDLATVPRLALLRGRVADLLRAEAPRLSGGCAPAAG